jgi:hypothetical protein
VRRVRKPITTGNRECRRERIDRVPLRTKGADRTRIPRAAGDTSRGRARGASDACTLQPRPGLPFSPLRGRHVLPPRIGGTLWLLERLDDGDVVLCAQVGLEGAASLAELWSGSLIGRQCVIQLRSTRIRALLSSVEGRIEWLHARWQSVDHFVESRRNEMRLRVPIRRLG